MASWLTFSQPVDVDVRLEGEHDRKTVEVKMDKDRKENCPIYFDGEPVVGQVSQTVPPRHFSSVIRACGWARRASDSRSEGGHELAPSGGDGLVRAHPTPATATAKPRLQ